MPKVMEDSESDWDSMTEREPSFSQKNKKMEKLDVATLQSEVPESSQSIGVQHIREELDQRNPPHSFKSEASPVAKARNKVPGKSRKSHVYDVPRNITTSKDMILDRTLDEDVEEDPLYSTIKKTISQRLPPITDTVSVINKPTEESPGFDNYAFEDPETTVDTNKSKVNCNASQHKELSSVNRTAVNGTTESIMENTDLNSSIMKFERLIRKCFDYVAFPFILCSVVITQTLRFVLLIVVQSFIFGVLHISNELLIKPFCRMVLHPILNEFSSLSIVIGGIGTSLCQPLIMLVKSCRIVETHKRVEAPKIV